MQEMAAVTINWMQINCVVILLLLSVVVNGKQHVYMCMYTYDICMYIRICM